MFCGVNQPLKIKKENVRANFQDGSLRMPDIFAYHANAKIGWVKQLNADDENKWSKVMWCMLNIDKHLLNHKLSFTDCKNAYPNFANRYLNAGTLSNIDLQKV